MIKHTPEDLHDDHVNVDNPDEVVITIFKGGSVVWVTIDGFLLFRAANIKNLVVRDERNEPEQSEN